MVWTAIDPRGYDPNLIAKFCYAISDSSADNTYKQYIKGILRGNKHPQDDYHVNNSLFRCAGGSDGALDYQKVCLQGCQTIEDDEGSKDACSSEKGHADHAGKGHFYTTISTTRTALKVQGETTQTGHIQIMTVLHS